MPSLFSFDSRVCRRMPSIAAAPFAPDTRPDASRRALSIIVFSRVVRSAANVAPGGDGSFDGKRIRDGDIAAPRTEQDHRHR